MLAVDPAQRFAALADAASGEPDVQPPDSAGGRRFAPNVKLTTRPSDSRIGQRYVIPSAKDLVEFGSRLALLSRPNAAVAAWPDTRNALVGEHTQDILSTEVLLPGEDRGVSITTIALVGGGAVVLIAVMVVLAQRRRSSK